MSQPLKIIQTNIDKRFVSIKEVLTLMDKHFSVFKTDFTLLDSIEDLIRTLDTSEKQELMEKIIQIRIRRLTAKL